MGAQNRALAFVQLVARGPEPRAEVVPECIEQLLRHETFNGCCGTDLTCGLRLRAWMFSREACVMEGVYFWNSAGAKDAS